MYLVDTDVISAGAPSKVAAPAGLVAWMDRHAAQLYLSAISVAEITGGIAKLQRQGASAKADRLAAWLDTLLHLHADRVLPFDVAVARVAGILADLARSQGQMPGFADVAIAATAKRHGLTVLTRNTRHFVPLAVPLIDPFTVLPAGEP